MDFICYWTNVSLRWVSIGLVSSFVVFFSQALDPFHTYIYTPILRVYLSTRTPSRQVWGFKTSVSCQLVISLCYKFLMPENSVKIGKAPMGQNHFSTRALPAFFGTRYAHSFSPAFQIVSMLLTSLNFRFMVLTLWQGSHLDLFFRGGRNGCGKLRKTLCTTLRNYLAFSHI